MNYRKFTIACLISLVFNLANADLPQNVALKQTAIKKIIVFGDSLSDNGNDYNTTQPLQSLLLAIPAIHSSFPTGIVPSTYHEPYYNGRFSNGPLWVEQLAHLFDIMNTRNHRANHFRFIDFAYGGALAHGTTLVNSFFPTPLYWQVAAYVSHQPAYSDKDKTLAILLIGANDYLDNTQPSFDPKAVTPVINAQLNAIKKLYHNGIQHFFIAGIPRLDITPLAKVRGKNYISKEKAFVDANNSQLKAAILALQNNTAFKNIQLTFVDLGKVHSNLNQNLADYGYNPELARTPCYPVYPMPHVASPFISMTNHQTSASLLKNTQIQAAGPSYPVYYDDRCADNTTPNQHIYFDDVHPSASLHCMLALIACKALKDDGYQRDSVIHQGAKETLNCHVLGTMNQQLQQAAQYCQAHRVLLPTSA